MVSANIERFFYCLLVIFNSLQINGSLGIFDEFYCINGQRVKIYQRCNGQIDCRDGSDEAPYLCQTYPILPNANPAQRSLPEVTVSPQNESIRKTTSYLTCKVGEFFCLNGECINQNFVCDGRRDCTDGSDESTTFCATDTIPCMSTVSNEFDINFSSKLISCVLPVQPNNGRWKLHSSLCTKNKNCDPPPNMREMVPGSHLVYECNKNYYLKGSCDVLCGSNGKWVNIPICEEIKCPGLNNESNNAQCTLNNQKIICNVPVPVSTVATVHCRPGFIANTHFNRHGSLTCQQNGQWSPEPVTCLKLFFSYFT